MLRLRSTLSTLAVIWALLFGLGYAHSAEVENILQNGGFEDGVVDPWATYGDVTIEVVKSLKNADIDEDPIEGKNALYITVNSKGANFWDAGLQYRNLTFEKGKKYTLAAFLKLRKNIVLNINFKPELAQDPWTGYGEQQFTMTPEWQEFHITTPEFAADVAPAEITFHIAFDEAEFWIDNVRFFEGDYAPPGDEPQAVEAKGKLTTTWGDIKTEK
jgi:hypothetical protein